MFLLYICTSGWADTTSVFTEKGAVIFPSTLLEPTVAWPLLHQPQHQPLYTFRVAALEGAWEN